MRKRGTHGFVSTFVVTKSSPLICRITKASWTLFASREGSDQFAQVQFALIKSSLFVGHKTPFNKKPLICALSSHENYY